MVKRDDDQYFQNEDSSMFINENYHTHENYLYHTYLIDLLKTAGPVFALSPTNPRR